MKLTFKISTLLGLGIGILCRQSILQAASYNDLSVAFQKAGRPALFQAKVVDDLNVQSCPASFVCQCNLVTEVDKAISNNKEPNYPEIIKNAQACSNDVIKELKATVGLAAGSDDQTFLKKLYDTSLIIKDVTPPEAVIKAGKFTPDNLGAYLQKAIDENKVFDDGLKNVVVTDIKSEGGAATLELFFVKNPKTNQEWIVKGIPSPKKEAFALSIVAQTSLLAPIIQPNSKPGFPIISLPKSYLGYKIGSKSGVLSVMMKASGKEFFQYMRDYMATPNDTTKTALIEAYKLVGQTLGNFHKQYRNNTSGNPILAPTYTHGDFHARNVFVDLQKKLVYWIDNERIGQTIFKPNSPITDWHYILFLTFNPFLAQKLFNGSATEQQKIDWVKTFYPSFLNAYLDAFGATNKQKAAQEMKNMLTQTKNPFPNDTVLRETITILDTLSGIAKPSTAESATATPNASSSTSTHSATPPSAIAIRTQ